MELTINKKASFYKIVRYILARSESEIAIKTPSDIKQLQPLLNRRILVGITEKFGKSVQIDLEKCPTATPTKKDNLPEKNSDFEEEGEAGSIKAALKVLGVIGGIFFVLALLGAFWYIAPRGEVKLVLYSEPLVKNIEITVDPKSNGVNAEGKVIPGVEISVTKSERKIAPATGKTTVGEKASGEVTIFNKTDSDKIFDKGTILYLERKKDNKYKLMDEVKVPKRTVTATSATSETVTFGSSKVRIFADKIGAEYNVEKGENFGFEDEDNSKYTCSNDNEKIKGGESKEVTAVSKEDIDKISQEMEETIIKALKDEIKNKLVSGQEFAEGSFSFTTVEQTYDKKIGEEAENIGLDQTAKAEAIVYSSEHLKTVVISIIKETIPDKYSLFGDSSPIELSNAIAQRPIVSDTGSRKMPLQIKVKSYIAQKVDSESIRNALLGQSIGSADKYLSEIKGLSSYSILVRPQFPGPLNSMPHIASQLKITVEHNQ
jgi:hypothetical protein